MKKYPLKLTGKQERFCQEYIVDYNATKAAKRAGFSEKSASTIGFKQLAKVAVQKRIGQLQESQEKRTQINADMILARIWEIANINLADAYNDDGSLKKIKDMPEEIQRAISGIKTYKDFLEGVEVGETKEIKLWDKVRALELLGKNRKLFTDKVEHSGKLTLEDIVAGSGEANEA